MRRFFTPHFLRRTGMLRRRVNKDFEVFVYSVKYQDDNLIKHPELAILSHAYSAVVHGGSVAAAVSKNFTAQQSVRVVLARR